MKLKNVNIKGYGRKDFDIVETLPEVGETDKNTFEGYVHTVKSVTRVFLNGEGTLRQQDYDYFVVITEKKYSDGEIETFESYFCKAW